MTQQEESHERCDAPINENRKPHGKIDVEFDFDTNQLGMIAPQLSDEEGEEFMDAVGEVMFAFVDLGFGVHAVQLANPEEDGKAELAELAESYVKNAG